jgi:ribosome-associated protein
MPSIEKAQLCMKTIEERKALDPVLMHVEALTSVADYFLITSGSSTRQVQAIARHLTRTLREAGLRAYGSEGEQEGQWVLLDYGDVIVHIFYQPLREFYDLEGLWNEAPQVKAGGMASKEVAP